jgi:hypothetical protein
MKTCEIINVVEFEILQHLKKGSWAAFVKWKQASIDFIFILLALCVCSAGKQPHATAPEYQSTVDYMPCF